MEPLAMDNVYDGLAVLDHFRQKSLIIYVLVGVVGVVVDPDSMYEPERLLAVCFPLRIVFVKCVVKIIMQYGINSDRIGSKIGYHLEPSEICLLVNGEIRRPFSRYGNAQIDPSYLERLIYAVTLHINGILIGFHKSSHRSIGSKIDIHAEIIIGVQAGESENDDQTHGKYKFLQRVSPPRA